MIRLLPSAENVRIEESERSDSQATPVFGWAVDVPERNELQRVADPTVLPGHAARVWPSGEKASPWQVSPGIACTAGAPGRWPHPRASTDELRRSPPGSFRRARGRDFPRSIRDRVEEPARRGIPDAVLTSDRRDQVPAVARMKDRSELRREFASRAPDQELESPQAGTGVLGEWISRTITRRGRWMDALRSGRERIEAMIGPTGAVPHRAQHRQRAGPSSIVVFLMRVMKRLLNTFTASEPRLDRRARSGWRWQPWRSARRRERRRGP